MLVRAQLALPRDARFVPIMRNLAGCLLHDVHVPQDAADDIEIAVTEACANVIRHAEGTDHYDVLVEVGVEGCTVEVVDVGPGFAEPRSVATDDAETGRGLFLMRALMDDLQFLRQDDRTRVRLVKRWSATGTQDTPGLDELRDGEAGG